uniref:Secreted protein n=1 Tax=Brugia timori TaxID=42155 RepID=A0A0R3QCG7_9BILA
LSSLCWARIQLATRFPVLFCFGMNELVSYFFEQCCSSNGEVISAERENSAEAVPDHTRPDKTKLICFWHSGRSAASFCVTFSLYLKLL